MVRRRVKVSVSGLNRSVVVYRGVGGLYNGFKKGVRVLREGIVRVGV